MDEKWQDIPGYKRKYQASNFGRIRNLETGLILNPQTTKKGYKRVSLYNNKGRTSMFVHKAILITFVGDRPDNCSLIRHLDGDPSNNHISNLRYGTHKENSLDCKKHGNFLIGEQRPQAKITQAIADEIRAEYVWYSRTHGSYALARKYGVSADTVQLVVKGATWTSTQAIARRALKGDSDA